MSMHQPVLVKEVLENLLPRRAKIIVDATVGTGGHAEAVLANSKAETKLVCIDRDENALNIAQKRLRPYRDRTCFIHRRFSQIEDVLSELNIEEVAGFLFDLGVCALHLDDPERGFSFQSDGPLDMRMDRSQSQDALKVINRYSLSQLVRILHRFGQERFSPRIARAIVGKRRKTPILTTFQLRELVEAVVNPKYRIKSLARVFQAIRMEVNQELAELKEGLNQAVDLLAPGGRLCVISYHSLEHRLIREKMRSESRGCVCPPHLPVCSCGAQARVRLITTKPITPSPGEIEKNPRSRSAKLWTAEKFKQG
jgi:16S rRNA (cytosine1402-N4)-methyltransferase